jgi:hypothetical protein
MEVPFPKEMSEKEGSFMVPCNYSDYETALQNEVPERWIKAFQKLV